MRGSKEYPRSTWPGRMGGSVRRYPLTRGDLKSAPSIRWETTSDSPKEIYDAETKWGRTSPQTKRIYIRAIDQEKSWIIYERDTIRCLSWACLSGDNHFEIIARDVNFFGDRNFTGPLGAEDKILETVSEPQ